MTASVQSPAAAVGVRMRALLARIELAASEVGLELETPRARDGLARILAAVSELDGLLSAAPPASHDGERADLNGVIEEQRERLGWVLAARGVVWRTEPETSQNWSDNATWLHRIVLEILRIAGQLGDGATFSIAPRRTDANRGIRFARHDQPKAGADVRDALAVVANGVGANLAIEGPHVTLWIPS